jgi:hypothetical protein
MEESVSVATMLICFLFDVREIIRYEFGPSKQQSTGKFKEGHLSGKKKNKLGIGLCMMMLHFPTRHSV